VADEHSTMVNNPVITAVPSCVYVTGTNDTMIEPLGMEEYHEAQIPVAATTRKRPLPVRDEEDENPSSTKRIVPMAVFNCLLVPPP
jgi:hypothetical protein